ncbi:dsRNA-binding ifn resistance/pkr inhibitor [Pteropox virus]|uniref:DsRNA-binding ifn resistance/pkr inhibitor n=1 Tax=Pteropox virus TaxID=1873698 RepID=A0A1B1MRF2_9POXV|nr:dsRNA-binding ifn resistance/pkr inhibitor [Pteropox virus]ANS71115.1 dsRNA-binding ifn resistance/pkr inhibitor [Pteropox virus]
MACCSCTGSSALVAFDVRRLKDKISVLLDAAPEPYLAKDVAFMLRCPVKQVNICLYSMEKECSVKRLENCHGSAPLWVCTSQKNNNEEEKEESKEEEEKNKETEDVANNNYRKRFNPFGDELTKEKIEHLKCVPPASAINEYCQLTARTQSFIFSQVETVPCPKFSCLALIDNIILASACGFSKRSAKNLACAEALKVLLEKFVKVNQPQRQRSVSVESYGPEFYI